MTVQILIVDDEQPIRESLSGLFEDEGYLVSTAASGEEAVARFRKSPADCVFLDIWMPGIDGLETMNRLKQINPSVPVIMMSGHATIDTAVRATKQGAFDFIEKPFSLDKLLIVLRNAVEKRRLELENSDLKFETKKDIPQLIGHSKTITAVGKQLDKYKVSEEHITLLGEHGTGKSVAARILHEGSGRHKASFATFSCVDMPKDKVETELLGYERGAFSGALQSKRGRLETAHQGTLFIEEISDIPLNAQEKILQVIKEKRLQRIGNPAHIACDVRIIFGTRYIKETLLQEDKILKNVYSQLQPASIALPALRDRSEDIIPLLDMLVVEKAARLGGDAVTFSDEVIQVLQGYSWPGNVRELRNYVERCQILCPGKTLTLETMLPLDLDVQQSVSFSSVPNDTVLLDGFHDARKRFECSYILHHLDKNEWNISKTAADIGMERSQLHRKIKSHDLTPSNK
ncbi:MAG: sigma-54 dependent transcriptional regulator [Ghiorsea sp.]